MSHAEKLLSASGLGVQRAGREVVSDVDIELRAGEIVALLGPNGAGKSTLLDALAGAVAPSSGSIERSGRVAIALQATELARRSALANVELALAWWGVPRGPERSARAQRALELMGVGHIARRAAPSLSGGERRRVHLARALAVEADVLLLDEPFAGLDGESRARLLEDAAGVLRSEHRATLVVVHERSEAWGIADRILVMLDGELAAEGPPRDLLGSPPSAAVARFLGFDGWMRDGHSVLLTRPAGVHLDPSGSLRGSVTRLVPLEDGVRVELTLVDSGAEVSGVLYASLPWPAPELGSSVAFRIEGFARFPASDLS
jgi:ABC-type sulfate/molybdate transport systems ATPase subunit